MKLSIIIPAYKGDASIPVLFDKIVAFFISNDKYQYEVVFVFDGGEANTWEAIKKLKNEQPEIIKAIKLSRNYGQHNALICGIKHAQGDFVITLDEDLQHDPEDIMNLMKQQREGDFDLVYGKLDHLKHSPFRNITSNLLKNLIRVSIPGLHPDYSAYRLIKTSIAKETLNMNNSYTFLDGYLSWITLHTSSTAVRHKKRPEGKSAYSIKKLVNHALNIFFTFSNAPIRFITYISVLIFTSSLIYSIYLLVRKFLFDDFITGYASTMLLMGFGIGILMFGIGVIGEYLYRINLKTTKRPNFIETEVL